MSSEKKPEMTVSTQSYWIMLKSAERQEFRN